MNQTLLRLSTISSLLATLGIVTPQAQGSLLSYTRTVSSIIEEGKPQSVRFTSIEDFPASSASAKKNKTTFHQLVQELQSLPVGKKYDYYLQTLEQQGYLIQSNYNDNNHWEFVLEKTQHVFRLLISYNSTTRTSTSITASGPRVVDVSL